MSIEAMKLMVEALEENEDLGMKTFEAIAAGRQAIAEAEKIEPVAWQDTRKTWVDVPLRNVLKEKRMTHPPKREWVGLTDEEIGKVCGFGQFTSYSTQLTLIAIAYAIEDKLKEKNT